MKRYWMWFADGHAHLVELVPLREGPERYALSFPPVRMGV